MSAPPPKGYIDLRQGDIMVSTICIRKAELGDNEALLKLQLRCPQGTDLVFQFDRSPDFFARSMPYERLWTFIAEEGDQIVGSIECALRDLYIGGVICKAMYVFGVMVDPEHRRKGIASMLQAEVDGVASRVDADLMYVFIVEENVPSIRMTEKMGFRLWKK
jgi:GNAT superfamily N-acetyltransferase